MARIATAAASAGTADTPTMFLRVQRFSFLLPLRRPGFLRPQVGQASGSLISAHPRNDRSKTTRPERDDGVDEPHGLFGLAVAQLFAGGALEPVGKTLGDTLARLV